MSDRIVVNPGGMEAMRSDVAMTAQQTLAIVEELISNLEALRAGFNGEAALAFSALKDAYASAKLDLTAHLAHQAQQVADAAGAYHRADVSASTYFS